MSDGKRAAQAAGAATLPTSAVKGLTVTEGGKGGIAADCLDGADASAQGSAKKFTVVADESVAGADAPAEACVCVAGSGGEICVLLHSGMENRSAAYYSKWTTSLVEAGFGVLTIDWPGYGRASKAKKLAARGSTDGKLLVAILRAFDVKNARVIAEGGGAAAFVRAFVEVDSDKDVKEQPDGLFGQHHVIINPIVSAFPPTFKRRLERRGADLRAYFCDGLGPTDVFCVCNCAVAFEFVGANTDRAEFIVLVPPKGPNSITTSGMKAMKPEKYLHGVTANLVGEPQPKAFILKPSEECCSDTVAYFNSPPREVPRDDGGPHAPTTSALMSGKENTSFKVYVRVRPFLQREEALGSSRVIKVSDVADFPRQPPPSRIQAGPSEFVFDRGFEPGSQQEVCEQCVRPLVDAVLKLESNATLFAYGQTGSGKTYTMEGPKGEEGAIHFAVHRLFELLPAGHTVHFQYVQLYDGTFLDLLEPEKKKALSVAEGAQFMVMQGARLEEARTAQQLLEAFVEGASFRATGATNMNDASSRSHAILILMLAPPGGPPTDGKAFYMVDLAGSERTKRSGVTGQGMKEATAINSALSTLGRVVLGLVEKDGQRAGHIPYKDNPLTYLLKSGIGGNSRTALIACITAAEDSLDESLNTLRFATQASHVKNAVDKREAKKASAAADGAIESAGHGLQLVGGVGEAAGVPVRGSWGGDLPVVLALPDSSASPWGSADVAQFDGLVKALEGKARVLALDLKITKEKDPTEACAKVLAVMDHIGIAKPVFLARDASVPVGIAMRIAHPKRVGALVLENRRDNVDEKDYKARQKKDPNYGMGAFGGPWSCVIELKGATDMPSLPNLKKFTGKNTTLLWPHQSKGRPCAANNKSWDMHVPRVFMENNKSVKLVNSHGWTDADLAKEVERHLGK